MELEGGFKLEQTADKLHQFWEKNKIFEVEVAGTVKHDGVICWECDLGGGYTGIVPEPLSNADNFMKMYVGTKIFVKIASIDHQTQKAVLDRKSAVEQNRLKLHFKPGDRISAAVRYITSGNVVMDAGGGVAGIMPRAYATLSRSVRLNDLFEPGQVIEVTVKEVEPEIILDRVSLIPDPWLTATYSRKDIVAGVVVGFSQGRPIIEVREGLTGIAPMPLSWTVQRGQKVRCQVFTFDRDKRRLHVRILVR